jgi:hypothetical protein
MNLGFVPGRRFCRADWPIIPAGPPKFCLKIASMSKFIEGGWANIEVSVGWTEGRMNLGPNSG